MRGKLTSRVYHKRDYFNFSFANFPYLCINIPSPAYGVYISLMIRYASACSSYDQFVNRGRLITHILKLHGFLQFHLRSAFRKFYGRYNDLVCKYNLALS
jgi:hypothetical protein